MMQDQPDETETAETLRARARGANRSLAIGLVVIALTMLAGAIGVGYLVTHVPLAASVSP